MQESVEELLRAFLLKLSRQHQTLVAHSGEDVSIAGRTGRAVDLQAIAIAVDANVYLCTGDAVNAAAEDLRSMCGSLRAAARCGVIPLDPAFEAHGEAIANSIEDTLDEVRVRQ